MSELAWIVLRLRDRTVATAARAEYHRQVEARCEARIDRVAHRFHRPGEPFASLLTQYIGGGVMAAGLSEELASYEGAPLGESVSEASHTDANYLATCASASTMSWWASSIRLRRNLAAYDAQRCLDGASAFHSLFEGWKAVLQLGRLEG